ncbi:ring finger ubiquitin ligase [Pyrenophora tritici-repentis]|nr:ring finger ubiquitin ligase [Pyrenophora tritici-repentis]
MLVPPMPVTLASSAPAGIIGTSMSLAQMLQSNTFLPLDLDSPDALIESPSAADDDGASIVEGESGDVETLSGRAAPSSSSRKMG